MIDFSNDVFFLRLRNDGHDTKDQLEGSNRGVLYIGLQSAHRASADLVLGRYACVAIVPY